MAIVDTHLDDVPFQLAASATVASSTSTASPRVDGSVGSSCSGSRRQPPPRCRLADVEDIDALARLDLRMAPSAQALRTRPGFTESLAAAAGAGPGPAVDAASAASKTPTTTRSGRFRRSEQASCPSTRRTARSRPDLPRCRLRLHREQDRRALRACDAQRRELLSPWAGEGRTAPAGPRVHERLRIRDETDGALSIRSSESPFDQRRMREVVASVEDPWTGQLALDTDAEKQLLQSFFGDVVEAIEERGRGRRGMPAPLLRVVSQEISRLVEACARATLGCSAISGSSSALAKASSS